MIPYARQDVSQADIDAVVEVLRSDYLTQGPVVTLFENAVKRYCGANHAIAISNATSALHLACLALGVGPGDRVWTSPNTFVASANSALYCGASVDFVDIDPQTYNMCVESLRQKLQAAKKKSNLPKVVIPVHFAGQSCDMAEIRKLSDFYGFKVIEDAAHAIGGSYKNQKIGSCSFSDVTIFSFHPVKIITTGEGGIAVTNDEALAQRIRLLSAHGIVRNSPLNPESSGRPGIWNYHQMSLGYNFRMTEFQAALGLSQVNRLEEFLSRRRQLVKKYNSALSDTGLGLPWQHPDSESSFHLYPVLIKQSQLGVSQRHFYDELINSGIGVNLHYIPVYLHPFYESKGFSAGLCPNAEQYFSETISLPLFSALSGEDQMAVITQVRRVLKL